MTIQQALTESDRLRNEVGDLQGAISILDSQIITSEEDSYYHWVLKLAALYRDAGKIKKAVNLYKKGLKIAKRQSENIFAADILRSLAFILLQDIKYEKAMGRAEEAKLLIEKQTGNFATETRANIYAIIGNIHFIEKRFAPALEVYAVSLKEAEKIDFHQRVITVTGDIANVFIEQEQFDKAIELITSTIENATKQYKIAVPQLLLRQGKVHLMKKDLNNAEKSFQTALKLANKENWIRDTAEANELLGDLFSASGKRSLSNKHYQKARSIYTKILLHSRAKIVAKKIDSHIDKNSV